MIPQQAQTAAPSKNRNCTAPQSNSHLSSDSHHSEQAKPDMTHLSSLLLPSMSNRPISMKGTPSVRHWLPCNCTCHEWGLSIERMQARSNVYLRKTRKNNVNKMFSYVRKEQTSTSCWYLKAYGTAILYKQSAQESQHNTPVQVGSAMTMLYLCCKPQVTSHRSFLGLKYEKHYMHSAEKAHRSTSTKHEARGYTKHEAGVCLLTFSS